MSRVLKETIENLNRVTGSVGNPVESAQESELFYCFPTPLLSLLLPI